jgi:hypothetical protein
MYRLAASAALGSDPSAGPWLDTQFNRWPRSIHGNNPHRNPVGVLR